MSGFVDLRNLMEGERYSFQILPHFPFSRLEGTFNRVTNLNGVDKYIFSNVISYVPDPTPNNPNNMRKEIYPIFRANSPEHYPQNIIHLPHNGALPPKQPPQLDEEDISPEPQRRGGKSRKSKRTKRTKRSRKSKRTRK